MRKKMPQARAPQPQPGTVVQNCSFQAIAAPANEHTSASIVALAKAAEANANAIGKVAELFKASGATLGTGVYIGNTSDEHPT